MKGIDVRAVQMVRRIRDRHARALAGKTSAEIIAFYRAAGAASPQTAKPPSRARGTPANKALPSSIRARSKTKGKTVSRAARG